MTRRYRISIDRLVLEGLEFTPEQAEFFRQGLVVALEAGLADPGLLNSLSTGRLERLSLPELSPTVQPGDLSSDPQQAGRLAGEGVLQGLNVGLMRGV